MGDTGLLRGITREGPEGMDQRGKRLFFFSFSFGLAWVRVLLGDGDLLTGQPLLDEVLVGLPPRSARSIPAHEPMYR